MVCIPEAQNQGQLIGDGAMLDDRWASFTNRGLQRCIICSNSADRVKYRFAIASEQHPSVLPNPNEPTSHRSANAVALIVSTNGFLDACCLSKRKYRLRKVHRPGEKWRVRVTSSTKLLLIVHLLHFPTCPTVLVVVLAFVVLSAVRLLVFPRPILF